jgi:hypothetical protein
VTTNQSPEDRDDDKLLRRVREAALHNQVDGQKPPANVLEACLLGHATPEQQEVLRRALETSPEFRQRYLELLRELDRVAGAPATAPRPDQADTVPAREQFLRDHGRAVPARRLPWRTLALAAVLVLAAVGSAWWLRRTPTPAGPESTLLAWQLSEREVDPALLIVDAPRGAGHHDSTVSFATPKEAAMAAYSRILRFDGRELIADTLSRGGHASEGPNAVRRVMMMLAERSGSARSLLIELPASDLRTAALPEAWSLSLPSRDLHTLTLHGDTTYASWPSEHDGVILLVVTAGDSAGFQAGSPQAVQR